MLIRNKLSLALAIAAGIAPFGAFATNGILPIGNGMIAHGVGGAGIANPSEAMSQADNPALMNHLGKQSSVGATIFNPIRSADLPGGGGYVKSDSEYFLIPQAAYVAPANDKFSWGISAYALGGMNTDYPDSLVGVRSGVDLSGLIVAPAASFAFTPQISAGAALLLGYEKLKMENVFANIPPGNPGVNGDDTAKGFGVRLGVDAALSDSFSVGAIYQPKLEMDEIDYLKTALVGFGFNGDAQITLPDTYGIGAKFAVNKSFMLIADVIELKWSGVELLDFFGWEDQTVFKMGGEWAMSDKVALRAGFNYGKSPIQGGKTLSTGMGSAMQNTWFPAITESHLTLGASFATASGMKLTGYYLRAFENEEQDTPAQGGAKIKMNQNALGIGANWKF